MHPQVKRLEDRSRPSWTTPVGPRPLAVRIWPSKSSGRTSAVVLSHGTGGAAEDLDWLARPLNDAGFLVASVDHHGNSYNTEYLAEGFAFAWERPRDISFLIDHLIQDHNVDADHIGAAGFSYGGYTVAALLGARIDVHLVTAIFQGQIPAPEVPEFPDLITTLRTKYSDTELASLAELGAGNLADARIRAGFLMAPAIGSLLDPASLQEVSAPVAIRWGEADDNAPPQDNALIYTALMPRADGKSVGSDVGHSVFLGDREDATGIRDHVADDALAFFMTNL